MPQSIRYSQPTRWPSGLSPAPWKALGQVNAWKAVGLSLAYAVIELPLLIVSLILLPWIPLIAQFSVWTLERGATWLGFDVTLRPRNQWFDVRQFSLHLAVLFIGAVDFFIWVALVSAVSLLAVIPFVRDQIQDQVISFGPWETGNVYATFAICWGLALLGLLILFMTSMCLSGLRCVVFGLVNDNEDEELESVRQSREILADAFTGERIKIERELHDGVQQHLTAIQVSLSTVELMAKQGQWDKLETPIHNGQQSVQAAAEAMRRTLRGIYPPVLQKHGLRAAIDELVALSGVSGTISEEGTAHLRATEALLLYHAASEGLTNAVKHGDAHNVRIRITYSDREAIICIDDDGAMSEPTNEGTGISGLRERARTLNGTAEFGPSEILKGAQLKVSIQTQKEYT